MNHNMSVEDMVGFSPYGEPGRGQYSQDNPSNLCTAELAADYVIKALGEKCI